MDTDEAKLTKIDTSQLCSDALINVDEAPEPSKVLPASRRDLRVGFKSAQGQTSKQNIFLRFSQIQGDSFRTTKRPDSNHDVISKSGVTTAASTLKSFSESQQPVSPSRRVKIG